MKRFIKINSKDNVIVALTNLKKTDILELEGKKINLKADIKRGHKVAIEKIKSGERIIKYGYPIGCATKNIDVGEWVHTQNVETNLEGILEYNYNPNIKSIDIENRKLSFRGYKRENGKVGIRNELWIIPTVGCVNGIGEMIIRKFKEEVNPKKIDEVKIFKHNYGCSQLGEDHENTKAILRDIVKHPNAGGVLVLGLGCENNHMEGFIDSLGEYNKERTKFLVAQEVDDEILEGVKLLKQLYKNMKKDIRQEIPISELVIGLKCGGSDGLSGITANPLLGEFSDFLISQGGSSILTEVPEMFGAETILMDRCVSKGIFDKTVKLINDFKEYFIGHNQVVYENPSPGNKAGGITTLEEKSLGCIQKSGSSGVVDVLKYGDVIKKKGLNLLSAPGNDLVAATALGASGCHMVLFTTGRGTPFGSFVPTMKISTNSNLYKQKTNWIDFNAGVLAEDVSMKELLQEFIDYIIRVASGEYVNNEKNKFSEIAIFKTGVTL
ncbi:UxaA family hydrolase [Paramaledivibacter caminithermalis]|jgi:altronate hydrolase|uniref:D-altronate dehydratase n=1 Tax=Paramaledivibacter caminithermalis (strain DSM 15212 / CIP 107654 / DViRD3) TaxID=1121301 RepID=A0A1M6NT54_PARC5|nr:altronate dehydratase family protein [Paramaledivibacter caminithermalis]SHJ98933.1 D-altronate dehydratase [Paramaledivibacter caminithermalis DSM 15212]